MSNEQQFSSIKKTWITPQGAILLWSWWARKIVTYKVKRKIQQTQHHQQKSLTLSLTIVINIEQWWRHHKIVMNLRSHTCFSLSHGIDHGTHHHCPVYPLSLPPFWFNPFHGIDHGTHHLCPVYPLFLSSFWFSPFHGINHCTRYHCPVYPLNMLPFWLGTHHHCPVYPLSLSSFWFSPFHGINHGTCHHCPVYPLSWLPVWFSPFQHAKEDPREVVIWILTIEVE